MPYYISDFSFLPLSWFPSGFFMTMLSSSRVSPFRSLGTLKVATFSSCSLHFFLVKVSSDSCQLGYSTTCAVKRRGHAHKEFPAPHGCCTRVTSCSWGWCTSTCCSGGIFLLFLPRKLGQTLWYKSHRVFCCSLELEQPEK